MTGGATFAHTLTTIYDDHADSQTWDRHVHWTCGVFISCRCVSDNPSEASTNSVPDGSDYLLCFTSMHRSRGSVDVVEEIADVYFYKTNAQDVQSKLNHVAN